MAGAVVVEPSAGALRGQVSVPGDKSVSHRAILLNTLASHPARVSGLLDSADVHATRRACEAVGARIEGDADQVVVHPPDAIREPLEVIDCGNSGTTMRLLAGLLAAEPLHAVLTGDGSLRRRPMGRITDPLRHLGVQVDGRVDGTLAPLSLRGPATRPTREDLTIASAQVKSAILLAGRHVGVSVREPRRSRDHTERMLIAMGAALTEGEDGWLELAPVERLAPLDLEVPGDISSAAFLLAAASLVEGSEVVLRGVGVTDTRAGVLDALLAMGADIRVDPRDDAFEPVADLRVCAAGLRGTRIDGELALRALDELPVLAVTAAFAEGETVIADAAELRVKESDRLARTAAGLRALGAEVEERPDGMVIAGGLAPAALTEAVEIDCTHDHRIAMAFAVAGLVRGPVRLVGADTSTSYPQFFTHLEALGG